MDGLPKAPRADVSGKQASEPGFMVQDSLGFHCLYYDPQV